MGTNETIIPRETLLKELDSFKKWSGPFLVKILADIPKYGSNPVPLGSGGLVKYKNRYFVLTNAHVVNNNDISDLVKEINIPYTFEDNSYKMTILEAYKDSQADIAIFEIRYNENILKSNHQFLEVNNIEHDIPAFVDMTNIVFLQGYPFYSTTIDNVAKEITAETLPYCTFVESFDETVNSLYLITDSTGIDENGNEVELSHFGGISGSFVYGYYIDENSSYKCLGVVTNWHRADSLLEVYPMNEFLDFIERKFFHVE